MFICHRAKMFWKHWTFPKSWCKSDTSLFRMGCSRYLAAKSSRAVALEDLAFINNLCDALIVYESILLSGRCGVWFKHLSSWRSRGVWTKLHTCPQEVWTRYLKHPTLHRDVSTNILCYMLNNLSLDIMFNMFLKLSLMTAHGRGHLNKPLVGHIWWIFWHNL